MAETAPTEELARHYLRDIEPPWRAFWLHMHLLCRNLEEFAAGLATIDDEVFVYHSSGQKNDLAAWVQEVVGDSELARALWAARNQREAAAAATARVALLKKILGKTTGAPAGQHS